MFPSIVTIAIAIAAVVYTVRNLIFTGLVERSWKDPMPRAGEEGYQEALQTRFRHQRTRVRSAVAVVVLFVASFVLTGMLSYLWPANLGLIRLAGMLVGFGTTLVVAIRAMVYEKRGSESPTKQKVEQYWKDRPRRTK